MKIRHFFRQTLFTLKLNRAKLPNLTRFLKTHYSKSQIFVQKFNFDKTPKSSRVFHPNFFLTIFLVKSKLSTAKKFKTTKFSRVFHPKKNRQFFREIKVEFLDKIWRFRTVCLSSLFKIFWNVIEIEQWTRPICIWSCWWFRVDQRIFELPTKQLVRVHERSYKFENCCDLCSKWLPKSHSKWF